MFVVVRRDQREIGSVIMPKRVAILGWGSLLWDPNPVFDAWHDPWQFDGPVLNIEFSRISESRGGALTLVLDNKHGAATQVAYCLSKRDQISEAVADLVKRERTSSKQIGFVHASGRARHRNEIVGNTIAEWRATTSFEGVVWTDLASNFEEKTGQSFSVDAAVQYVENLGEDGRLLVLQYIVKAPDFVRTPLRRALSERRLQLGP